MALWVAQPGDINSRALPRGNREPVPIPSSAPVSHTQRTGDYNGGGWGAFFGRAEDGSFVWPTRWEEPAATEQSVTGIPAAWKCLNFIANAAASCAPPIEFDSAGERVTPLSNVVERPWAFITAHEYWVQALTAALLFGNFIGINIDIDPDTGYPRQCMPVHPNDVALMLIDGMPVYSWAGEAFGWDEVTHVRGYTSPGSLWGVGVIEAFRKVWENMLNLAQYGAGTYVTAAENSVIIQVDRPELTEAQATQIQDAWVARHGSGVRRPAVLPRSMTVSPLSFSPADAQYLESQQLGIAQVAFMFGMDPTDLTATIGSAGSITYANREQREIERLTHAVGPWLRRFEQAWADLLPGRRNMRFNVENLLRTDTMTRMQSTEIALRAGVFTLNDARNVEKLPHYGTWADEPFVDKSDVPGVPTPEPSATAEVT